MSAHRWLRAILCIAAAALAAACFVPLLPSDLWEVRVLGFPRLQFAVALAPVLAGLLALPRSRVSFAATALAGAALVLNALLLFPYTTLATPTAGGVQSCGPDERLRLLVANVQMRNRESDRLLDLARRADADAILLLETDAWWHDQLAALRPSYPNWLAHPQANFYGMHLLSRRELASGAIRPGAGDLPPTLQADIRLGSGAVIRLYGLHPRPPRPGQSATGRDVEILGAARRARDDGLPSVIAGDLNAVPWERVIRRALRIAGLTDPRVGRGFLATWLAQSNVVRWPIDHILPDASLGIAEFQVLPDFGSDHLPVLASLCSGRL